MGNVCFIIYAISLSSIPVLITNSILLCINVWYLIKVYRRQENFDMLTFKGDEKMAQKFIQFYQQDIANYFPGFAPAVLMHNFNFVVIRDLVIANMFSAKVEKNGDAIVSLNYTLQKYRDYKVGTYIFEKERDFLIANGVKRIVYTSVPNKNHQRFLSTMGFTKEAAYHSTCFVKALVEL